MVPAKEASVSLRLPSEMPPSMDACAGVRGSTLADFAARAAISIHTANTPSGRVGGFLQSPAPAHS